MPAPKRWPHKQNIQFSDEEFAWAKQQAAQRATSVAAVIRDLIRAEMRKEAQ